MKIVYETIASMLLICLVKCTTTFGEIEPFNQEEEPDTDLLYFSFNKETYDDFKCNVSNELLTHRSMYEPPFCKSESTRNFLSTLCLFVQYSELKKNELFRNGIESFFKIYYKSLHLLDDNDVADLKYDPDTFKDRLIRLDNTIKGILEEQDLEKQKVFVKEEDGRYIVSQKYSLNNPRYRIVKEDINKFHSEYLNNEVLVSYFAYLTKLCEFYLEGKLGKSFSKANNFIMEGYKRASNDPNFYACETSENTESTTNPTYKLVQLLHRCMNLFKSCYYDDLRVIFQSNPNESFSDKIVKTCMQYLRPLFDKLNSGDVPEYLYDLFNKVNPKIVYETSKGDTFDLEACSLFLENYFDSMFMIKDTMNEYFRDSKKIVFDCQLSDQSIENLVKICLELVQ